MNPKVEEELVEFKQEIEKKFEESDLRNFKFPFLKKKNQKQTFEYAIP